MAAGQTPYRSLEAGESLYLGAMDGIVFSFVRTHSAALPLHPVTVLRGIDHHAMLFYPLLCTVVGLGPSDTSFDPAAEQPAFAAALDRQLRSLAHAIPGQFVALAAFIRLVWHPTLEAPDPCVWEERGKTITGLLLIALAAEELHHDRWSAAPGQPRPLCHLSPALVRLIREQHRHMTPSQRAGDTAGEPALLRRWRREPRETPVKDVPMSH